MILNKLILIILLISNISWAQDSTFLNKGQPATFDGYLLPQQTVKNLRNDSLELGMYQRIDPLKDQQLKLVTDDRDNLAKTLQSTSSLSTWEKIGYFSAGVILTGLAIDAASKITK